ncbi:MAG: hypothetical protein ACTMHH_01675 [Nesterenkonia sp.]
MNSCSGHTEAVHRARRRLATVLVEGLGVTGIRIAEQIIGLGVGTVLLRDERTIAEADPFYRRSEWGRLRADAACRMLRRRDSGSAVLEAPEDSSVIGLDLHVIVADDESACGRLRAAAQSDCAVLPVELSAAGFCVGPVLAACGGVCPQCLVLHGLTDEPGSPRPQGGPAQSRRPALGPAEAIAVGVAAHQVQVLIDGDTAAAAQTGALLGDAATGRVDHREVRPHPECRCLTHISADRGRVGVGPRRHRSYATSADMLVGES